MANLFQEVLSDAKGVEAKLLGPSYPYYKNIKMPNEIGMSDKGSLKTLGKDVNGLINYVEVLVTGKSKASATGGPLGNKFFLQTGGKCLEDVSNNQVDRYIYIDNVPDGNIPFLSSGMGANFSDFEGLIPGAMGNLAVLNPFNLMKAFLSGATPPCQEITMQTIDSSNNKSTETHYVITSDIKGMDPCTFSNKVNPITNVKCKEVFSMPIQLEDNELIQMPKDIATQIYFFALSGIAVYFLYKIMLKSK